MSSKDTLYALSREGAGSAGAIVTALTSAVCEAAEQKAIANLDRSGRLAVPLVCVLDEAANVCRWPELPALYSHYGSRGINLITFLQSYAQGVSVWGQDGMATLWSAATIRIYGGGVADQRWLSELSDLIGDHDETHRSITHRRGERSVSVDVRQRRTITAAQLAALPRDRIICSPAVSRWSWNPSPGTPETRPMRSTPPERHGQPSMTEQLLSPTPLPEAAGERVETFLRWFTDVLSPVLTAEWGRNDRVLCEHWWEHPEAVARLLALHDAWTVMVEGDEDSEPSADGPSRWWIEHFDPHLDALLHPGKGPFRFCRNGHAPEKSRAGRRPTPASYTCQPSTARRRW